MSVRVLLSQEIHLNHTALEQAAFSGSVKKTIYSSLVAESTGHLGSRRGNTDAVSDREPRCVGPGRCWAHSRLEPGPLMLQGRRSQEARRGSCFRGREEDKSREEQGGELGRCAGQEVVSPRREGDREGAGWRDCLTALSSVGRARL